MVQDFILSQEEKVEPDRIVVVFSENLGLGNLNLMEEWVSEDLQDSEIWLIIDLKNVKFLYSKQVSVLYLAAKTIKKNKGKLGFINASRIVLQSFKAMKLKSLVDIKDSEEELIDLWIQ